MKMDGGMDGCECRLEKCSPVHTARNTQQVLLCFKRAKCRKLTMVPVNVGTHNPNKHDCSTLPCMSQ